MNQTFQIILNRQVNWADSNNIAYHINKENEPYCLSLASNIYFPTLSTSTVGEYSAGKGNEFKENMKSLCSSSALVVNVFEYWRQNNRVPDIAAACGKYSSTVEMSFEKTHHVFNRGTPPHLDIEFGGGRIKPLAIEAKFAEPYRKRVTRRNKTNLRQYLSADIWQGLGSVKGLAQEVLNEEGDKTSWGYLGVPQLIKHILGLQKSHPNGFTLLYLWFDCNNIESLKHKDEVSRFYDRVCSEVDFQSLTYQELFTKFLTIPGVDQLYLKYLKERYL